MPIPTDHVARTERVNDNKLNASADSHDMVVLAADPHAEYSIRLPQLGMITHHAPFSYFIGNMVQSNR